MARNTTRRKDFSQNFLHDRHLIRHLVRQAGIAEDDLVIEVGPGNGALTAELLRHARQVLAVEVDSRLVERLQTRFANERGLILFAGDFLEFPLPQTPYKVFASLPYRHTAAIVGKLTTGVAPPADMFLVMQAEAAQRFMGDPQGTMLAAQLAPWFDLEIIHRFRRTDFRPAPAVDSVMLRVHRRESPLVSVDERERYVHLIAGAYTAWQPSVEAALASLLTSRTWRAARSAVSFMPPVRPSTLATEEWIALFDAIRRHASAADWTRLADSYHRLKANQAILERPSRTRKRQSPSQRPQ